MREVYHRGIGGDKSSETTALPSVARAPLQETGWGWETPVGWSTTQP